MSSFPDIQVLVFDLDKTRINYQAMVHRLGEKAANAAFRRALNHTGSKALTSVRKALRTQTSIPAGRIRSSTRLRRANFQRLSSEIVGVGQYIPLRDFNARQFKYGVRAFVWGRSQQFKSAFIVDSISGNVFKRVGRSRLPIEMLYGPSVPSEMVQGQSLQAFEQTLGDLQARAAHELNRILTP